MQKSMKRLIIQENTRNHSNHLFKIFFNSIKNKRDISDNKIM